MACSVALARGGAGGRHAGCMPLALRCALTRHAACSLLAGDKHVPALRACLLRALLPAIPLAARWRLPRGPLAGRNCCWACVSHLCMALRCAAAHRSRRGKRRLFGAALTCRGEASHYIGLSTLAFSRFMFSRHRAGGAAGGTAPAVPQRAHCFMRTSLSPPHGISSLRCLLTPGAAWHARERDSDGLSFSEDLPISICIAMRLSTASLYLAPFFCAGGHYCGASSSFCYPSAALHGSLCTPAAARISLSAAIMCLSPFRWRTGAGGRGAACL